MNVQITLSDEQLDEIARRAVGLLPATDDSWLTVVEAAEYLRCPTSRIYSLSRHGRIPHVKDGSRTLLRRSELDVWLRAGGGKRP
jgi:excisionase family DNA binding protein